MCARAARGCAPRSQRLFERAQAFDYLSERREPTHLDELDEADFELVARVCALAQLPLRLGQAVEEANDVRLGELARLRVKLAPLGFRGVAQRGVARDLEDEKVAQVREQVAAEVAQVLAARAQFFDDRERFRRSLFGDGAHDARQHLRARDSERGLDICDLNDCWRAESFGAWDATRTTYYMGRGLLCF